MIMAIFAYLGSATATLIDTNKIQNMPFNVILGNLCMKKGKIKCLEKVATTCQSDCQLTFP